MSYKKQVLLILREHLSSPPFFSGVRVAHLFNFLCCPIMCLYVLSSVLWCPLRFPHKTVFGSSLPLVVCSRAHTIGSEKFQNFKYGTFLTLTLKLMQWYVTSVSRGSLYEKFGNKCVKILKFWRTELSHAQNKNRGKKMRLLGMDTCPSLNDIMEIRCNKCTRSEQGYDF